MRGTKLWIAIAGAVLIISVVGFIVYHSFTTAAIEVKTARAEVRLFEDKILETGKVQSVYTVDLVAPFAARLLSLKVKEGDRVVPSQVLAEMDPQDAEKTVKAAEAGLAVAEAELAQAQVPATAEELDQAGAALKAAEAQADAARKRLERQRSLFDQGAVSKAELEAVETEDARAQAEQQAAAARLAALKKTDDRKIKVLEARVAQAQVAADNARSSASEGKITAPVSGIVLQKPVNEGDFLQMRALILTIGNPDQLQVVVDLSEQDVRGITAGQEAEIQWAGQPGQTWLGKVSRVSPAVTKSIEREAENAVRVYLEFVQDQRNLLPGATVDVLIHRIKSRMALLVPNEAVVGEGETKAVFVVEGNVAYQRSVTVGYANELFTEIKAGLQAGDKVILSPQDLQDGQRVRETGGEKT